MGGSVSFPRDKWSNNVVKSSWFQEVNSWIFNYKGLKSITTQRGAYLICRKREIAVFCDLNDLNTKTQQQSSLLKGDYSLYPKHTDGGRGRMGRWGKERGGAGERDQELLPPQNWMRKGWQNLTLSTWFTILSSALWFSEVLNPLTCL